MTADNLDSAELSTMLPILMPDDSNESSAAAMLDSGPAASQPGTGGRLTRSGTLVPPLVSLPPLYISSAKQQQQQQQPSISGEIPGQLPSDMIL